MDIYAASKSDAMSRLGSLYNALEYPAPDKVLESFNMSYQFIECSTPGRLRDISPEMFERERAKAESTWLEAVNEARTMLRTELANLVDHLNDRLGVDEEGKPKKFKNSLVQNMNQFLELFTPRNIANDAELALVVEQCKAVLGGTTAEQIRDDSGLRSRLQHGFAGIREQVAGLVTTQGRRIVLDTQAAESWGDDI
jgi:hypothetical protein